MRTLRLRFLIGALRHTWAKHRSLQPANRVQMLRGWRVHCKVVREHTGEPTLAHTVFSKCVRRSAPTTIIVNLLVRGVGESVQERLVQGKFYSYRNMLFRIMRQPAPTFLKDNVRPLAELKSSTVLETSNAP